MGAIPTVCVFRPLIGTQLEHRAPPRTEDLVPVFQRLYEACMERGLPITCQELYDRLKQRGVVVVPGHYFFPGLDEEWQHRHECIRVSYAGEDKLVQQGVQIIAEVVRQAYSEG